MRLLGGAAAAAAGTLLQQQLSGVSAAAAAAASVAAAEIPVAVSASQLSVSANPIEDALYPEGNCPPYPNPESDFERAVPVSRLEDVFRRLPSTGTYRGIPLGAADGQGQSAAVYVHRDIACALTQHADFKDVFGTKDRTPLGVGLFSGAQEFSAFLTFVLYKTNFFKSFEASSPLRECVPDDDAPCAEGVSYKARGPLGIKGNRAYADFGLFAFNDQTKFLEHPELLGRQDVGAWVAALWKWTRKQSYGDNCERWFLGRGLISPHEALQSWDSALPAAEALPLLQTAKDYPTYEPSLAAAAKPFGGFGLAVSLFLGEAACCAASLGALRVAQRLTDETKQQAVSRHVPDGEVNLLLPSEVAGQQPQPQQQQQQQQGSLLPTITAAQKVARFDAIMAGLESHSMLQQQQQQAEAAAAAAANVAPILGTAAAGGPLSATPLSRVLLPPSGPIGEGEETAVSPLTAARVEGLFLSLLSFFLPPRPLPQAAGTETAVDEKTVEALALPNPLAASSALPLPGAKDCIGVFIPEDGETPGEEAEARLPFRLFCYSMVRGCPALSGLGAAGAAALGESKEETEEARRQVATDTGECKFRCYPVTDATLAAGQAATTAAVAATPAVAVVKPPETYLSKQGTSCAFFCP